MLDGSGLNCSSARASNMSASDSKTNTSMVLSDGNVKVLLQERGGEVVTDFEWTFIVTGLNERRADGLLDDLDCIVGTTHGREDFVTVTASGPDAASAGRAMLSELAGRGLTVVRSERDLVDRQDISNRLGVSRQNIGQWVRGERGLLTFPLPFSDVSGGVWLWGDVVGWLRRTGRNDGTAGMEFPSAQDHDLLNALIAGGGVTAA